MYVDGRERVAPSRQYNVRRRDPRYVASVPIALQRFLRYRPVVTRGVTLDISVRGMAALVCGAPNVGEMVVITLSLPSRPVEVLATVRHSSEARCGFEFFPLACDAQQGLQDWIEELRAREEKLFPYPYAAAAKSGGE